MYAAVSIGAIFVPLNWRLTEPELSHIIDDSGARLLIASPAFADTAAALHSACDFLADAIIGWDAYEAALAAGSPEWVDTPVALEDPAMILYTSGTTGRPKGAVLTHSNVSWNAFNLIVDRAPQPDDVELLSAPLFHVGPLNVVATVTIVSGGTLLLMEAFDAFEVLRLIEAHRVTSMFAVPAMMLAMSQHPDWETRDLSSLRQIMCGGAPVPLPLIHTALARGITFVQGYGLTETAPGALWLRAERTVDKAGSAGKSSFFTDVKVVRPDGTEVTVGEPGEVVISGPNVMAGYWNLPEATAESLKDGWFHSGDVATVDSDGYITIVDRIKDMIISGGENIYPAEIESVLYEHPSIAECAVIGIPDERWGEVGRAVVVLRNGAAATADDLIEHLGKSLARYKIPKTVVFTDQLPRSGAGKILRREIRQEHGS